MRVKGYKVKDIPQLNEKELIQWRLILEYCREKRKEKQELKEMKKFKELLYS